MRRFRTGRNVLDAAVQLCTLPRLGFVPDEVTAAPATAVARLPQHLGWPHRREDLVRSGWARVVPVRPPVTVSAVLGDTAAEQRRALGGEIYGSVACSCTAQQTRTVALSSSIGGPQPPCQSSSVP